MRTPTQRTWRFSITEGGLWLTPHYDFVSTEVFRELERSLAMKIGRSKNIRNVQRSDWRLFAERVGLLWDIVRVLLLRLAESVASGAADVMRRCVDEFGEAHVYSMIAGVVERHAEQLTAEQLTRELTAA